MFELYVIINRLLEMFLVVRRIPSIQLYICFWTCTCPSAALNDIDISDIYKPCNKCACFCPVFFCIWVWFLLWPPKVELKNLCWSIKLFKILLLLKKIYNCSPLSWKGLNNQTFYYHPSFRNAINRRKIYLKLKIIPSY